jgi:hypothetical protein
MSRILLTVASMVAGSLLTRWYDRSPKARAKVFWLFTRDLRGLRD